MFDDVRRFGTFNVATDLNFLNVLGPSVFDISFRQFVNIFSARRNKMVATAIVDQSIISGIGNYLRSEILFQARINPRSKIRDIDLNNLYNSMKIIIRNSLRSGGSESYKNIYGVGGNYEYVIYKKKSCGKFQVQVNKIGGRKIYWIPELQTRLDLS